MRRTPVRFLLNKVKKVTSRISRILCTKSISITNNGLCPMFIDRCGYMMMSLYEINDSSDRLRIKSINSNGKGVFKSVIKVNQDVCLRVSFSRENRFPFCGTITRIIFFTCGKGIENDTVTKERRRYRGGRIRWILVRGSWPL